MFQYPEYQLFAESVIADVEYGPRNLGWSNLDVEYRSYEALKQVGIGEMCIRDRAYTVLWKKSEEVKLCKLSEIVQSENSMFYSEHIGSKP